MWSIVLGYLMVFPLIVPVHAFLVFGPAGGIAVTVYSAATIVILCKKPRIGIWMWLILLILAIVLFLKVFSFF